MRSTTVLGAALIVIVIVLIAVFALPDKEQPSESQDISGIEEASPLPSSGQFFQEIPAELEATAQPTPSEIKVTMSEVGFSPSEVTVISGTTVTFVNDGQAAHWPASDLHPTHSVLPEFDAKRGLATGESYSYTFTKAGVWHCHDHLMPQSECTITVQ